jgi:hypothetical protein
VLCVDGCPAGSLATGREWIGTDGPCDADGGGPAIDASNLVIGVNSRGGATCTTPVYERLDVFAVWLKTSAIGAATTAGIAPPSWAGGGAGDAMPGDAATDATTDIGTASDTKVDDTGAATSAAGDASGCHCTVVVPTGRLASETSLVALYLAGSVLRRRRAGRSAIKRG